MAHVASVDRSMAFYALLGFTPVNVQRDHHEPYWALMSSGKAEIMLARASGPIDAPQQAVLFYLYTTDVAALRAQLLARGVIDAGSFQGAPEPKLKPGSANRPDSAVLFEITRPPYMPAGEMRVHDPDGYVLLVGQLS